MAGTLSRSVFLAAAGILVVTGLLAAGSVKLLSRAAHEMLGRMRTGGKLGEGSHATLFDDQSGDGSRITGSMSRKLFYPCTSLQFIGCN
jgi:hypothetical protein